MAQLTSPHALYISEILFAISYYLEDDRKTLARLARCCHAFSEPALSVLWSSVRSFSPFIPLLPPTVKFLWVSMESWQQLRHTQECVGPRSV
jgi:hypothetical protein